MQDEDVRLALLKVRSGALDEHLPALESSAFGIYLPIYLDGDRVTRLPPGYSQVETDLDVSVLPTSDIEANEELQSVAWFGGPGKPDDSKCSHPKTGPYTCKHCTKHTGNCRHCTGHPQKKKNDASAPINFEASELDYDAAIATFEEKRPMLAALESEGFGLGLLHGHSDRFKFTELPIGYVSVVTNGRTEFRTNEEVAGDKSFVPNIWRSVGGRYEVAGGLSAI
jgi:hypothetical protein